MRNIPLMTGLPFNLKPPIDITDQLPSRPNPNDPRSPDQVTFISVHHSAVEGQGPAQYADWHVNHNGWPCIGYHMVVSGDQIYQTNDLLTFSYHTSSNNHYTVSVSVSGDLSKRSLSEVERNALYAVILTYMSLFNIPVEHVLGHNEFPQNSTSCPCIDMNRVRDDIRTIQNRMKYSQSDENKKATAYRIANEVLFLYNMAQGKNADGTPTEPGNVEWAVNTLMDLKVFMDNNGIQY